MFKKYFILFLSSSIINTSNIPAEEFISPKISRSGKGWMVSVSLDCDSAEHHLDSLSCFLRGKAEKGVRLALFKRQSCLELRCSSIANKSNNNNLKNIYSGGYIEGAISSIDFSIDDYIARNKETFSGKEPIRVVGQKAVRDSK